jgi:ubiquinone/menaquinone biosynthesis C-methylase UbiE
MTLTSYEYDMDNPLVYKNEMGRYKTERQLSFIRKFLPHQGTAVLDIGGGSGRLALPIAELGHKVTVTDVSREALDLLKTRARNRVIAIHSDILSFEPHEQFEVAMAIDMLKYVSSVSLSTLFAKVNSLLQMRGVLLLAEINKGSWRNHLSELLGRRKRQRYNIESADGYRNALRTAGFEIEAMTGFVWMPLPVSSNSRLVRTFKILEDKLHLASWTQQSPWLLIAARKVNESRALDSRTA